MNAETNRYTQEKAIIFPQNLPRIRPPGYPGRTRNLLAGKIDTIFPPYAKFIKELTAGEKVCINVRDEMMKSFAAGHLEKRKSGFE